MDIIKLQSTTSLKKASRIACIGFFDALHVAHQAILQRTKELYQQHQGTNKKLVFITFNFQLDVEVKKDFNFHIMNQDQKQQFIEKLGYDEYIEIQFDKNLQQLTYQAFNDLLVQMGVEILVCGEDFKYGYQRLGNTKTLKQGLFQVEIVKEYTINNEKISTSLIKKHLCKGDIKLVNDLLKRNYAIQAIVVEGKKLGRKIGFPTANLDRNHQYQLPKVGVYYGYITYKNVKYKAMISVGLNPTVETLTIPVIEAHILDFNQDIYNQSITVEFVGRIRDEIKFSSIELLIEQLKKDEQIIRGLL